MAKTIKFNLICDGNPIRNLEDLQNNFSVEDVLGYYNNKLLHRWLKVRGYERELGFVNEITDEEPINIVKKLISIFDVSADEKYIDECTYMLEYIKERKEKYSIYEQNNYKAQTVLSDFQDGYQQLITTILENVSDITKIKSAISEMLENYYDIFKTNYRALFYTLYHRAPMAVFVLLTFDKARMFYLPLKVRIREADSGEEREIDDIECPYPAEAGVFTADKKQMYIAICNMIKKSESILGENIRTFSGVTDGYWKDLEEKGKKYMILSMNAGDYIRSAGEKDGDLKSADIKERFVILDGIDYKSNNVAHTLCYMEV